MKRRITDRLPAIVVFTAGFLLGGVFTDLTYPNPTEQECWLHQQNGSRTNAVSPHTTPNPNKEEQNGR